MTSIHGDPLSAGIVGPSPTVRPPLSRPEKYERLAFTFCRLGTTGLIAWVVGPAMLRARRGDHRDRAVRAIDHARRALVQVPASSPIADHRLLGGHRRRRCVLDLRARPAATERLTASGPSATLRQPRTGLPSGQRHGPAGRAPDARHESPGPGEVNRDWQKSEWVRTRRSKAPCVASTRRSSRAASSPRLADASTTRSPL